MGLLIRSNFHEVGIEGVHVASVHKIRLGVVLETFLVEGGLEMLERQSVVQDIS